MTVDAEEISGRVMSGQDDPTEQQEDDHGQQGTGEQEQARQEDVDMVSGQ
jgi:hypothetical protein